MTRLKSSQDHLGYLYCLNIGSVSCFWRISHNLRTSQSSVTLPESSSITKNNSPSPESACGGPGVFHLPRLPGADIFIISHLFILICKIRTNRLPQGFMNANVEHWTLFRLAARPLNDLRTYYQEKIIYSLNCVLMWNLKCRVYMMMWTGSEAAGEKPSFWLNLNAVAFLILAPALMSATASRHLP